MIKISVLFIGVMLTIMSYYGSESFKKRKGFSQWSFFGGLVLGMALAYVAL